MSKLAKYELYRYITKFIKMNFSNSNDFILKFYPINVFICVFCFFFFVCDTYFPADCQEKAYACSQPYFSILFSYQKYFCPAKNQINQKMTPNELLLKKDEQPTAPGPQGSELVSAPKILPLLHRRDTYLQGHDPFS